MGLRSSVEQWPADKPKDLLVHATTSSRHNLDARRQICCVFANYKALTARAPFPTFAPPPPRAMISPDRSVKRPSSSPVFCDLADPPVPPGEVHAHLLRPVDRTGCGAENRAARRTASAAASPSATRSRSSTGAPSSAPTASAVCSDTAGAARSTRPTTYPPAHYTGELPALAAEGYYRLLSKVWLDGVRVTDSDLLVVNDRHSASTAGRT